MTTKDIGPKSALSATMGTRRRSVFALLLAAVCWLMAVVPADAQDASVIATLDTTEAHLTGASPLTTAQLEAISEEIEAASEQGTFSGPEIVARGYEVIQTYETSRGPLFTSRGLEKFSVNTQTTDLGYWEARVLHELYQAVFHAIDVDLVRDHPSVVDGLKFGSVEYFPGDVAAPAPGTTSIYPTTVDATLAIAWGRPTLYSGLPAVRPTGAYVAPGSIVEVTVPNSLVNQGFQIQIGANPWDLSDRKNDQKRQAVVSNRFDITSTTTAVANPNGGNVLIVVPTGSTAGLVQIEIKDAVLAPLFSMVAGQETSVAEWQSTQRNHPGPFALLVSDHAMLHVPSKWMRTYDNPSEILAQYDRSDELVSDYMGRPQDLGKPNFFATIDVIFRGNAFFPGYPMSNYPDFDSELPAGPMALNVAGSAFSTSLHEQGHATYMTKFSGEIEAAVHMLSVYVRNLEYGYDLEEAWAISLAYGHGSVMSALTFEDSMNSWVLRPNFLDGLPMDKTEAGYQHRGHVDYVEYVDIFGWEAMESFNNQLNIDYENGITVSRNDHDTDDRLLRLSRAAGADVRPLFAFWGQPPEDDDALGQTLAAEGLEPSAEIYDLLVNYKSSIVTTQSEFDAWWPRMSTWVNQHEGYYDDIGANFDGTLAAQAQTRTQEIIDMYFESPPIRLGDVQCDDQITAVDALMVLEFGVGSRQDSGGCPLADPAQELDLAAGDIDGDGIVGLTDALLIAQCSVGISNGFCNA